MTPEWAGIVSTVVWAVAFYAAVHLVVDAVDNWVCWYWREKKGEDNHI